MNTSKYRFTLDMQSDISQISLPVREQDNNRELLINLTDSGTPYIIERGCYAELTTINADRVSLVKQCSIIKNTIISVVLDESITYLPGVVDCEIRLYGSEGELITSPSFILVVNNRVTHNGDYVIPEGTKDVLDQMMEAEANRVAAEADRVAAEETRQTRFDTTMESATSKINQTISSASIAEGLAKTALNSANDALTQAQSASSAAIAAVEQAYEAIGKANEASEKAEEAASITVSPEVTIDKIEGGHKVTVKDVHGTKTFDVMDGEDGASGGGLTTATGSYTGTGADIKTIPFTVFTPSVVIIQTLGATGIFINGISSVINLLAKGADKYGFSRLTWTDASLTITAEDTVAANRPHEAFNVTNATYRYVMIP